MKRNKGLIGILAFFGVVGLAIGLASQMGETSHALARGRVLLDPGLVEQARGIRTLYVIGLHEDGRPMPLGAVRFTLGADPTAEVREFILTPENAGMMGGGEWPDQFKLKARLDRDGEGGGDRPGDLVGELSGVRRGQRDIELRISKQVP